MFYLVLESHDGRAPGADSEEKREPVSDIDTAVADSLKVLDLKWPIREADIPGPLPWAQKQKLDAAWARMSAKTRAAAHEPKKMRRSTLLRKP